MVTEQGYRVQLTVIEAKGKPDSCAFGHKLGDVIVFHSRGVEGEICPSVLAAIMPTVYAMRWGVEFPWLEDKDADRYSCPDPEGPLVFEIRKMKD